MDDRAIGRGAFLGLVGSGLLGLFFARDLTSAARRVLPSQVDAFVPGSNWRIYTVGSSMPNIAAADFRLTVDGMVDRPATLSLADLQAVGHTEQVSDFHCVTGWTVDDVRWVGVTLRDLLGHVGAQSGAKAVRFISAEKPYEYSLTHEQAMLGDVMLAWQMDGAPLSREHGGTLKLGEWVELASTDGPVTLHRIRLVREGGITKSTFMRPGNSQYLADVQIQLEYTNA